jgi:hypothetical protein
MKCFKVISIGILVIIIAGIGFITYQYNTFKPNEVNQKIENIFSGIHIDWDGEGDLERQKISDHTILPRIKGIGILHQ